MCVCVWVGGWMYQIFFHFFLALFVGALRKHAARELSMCWFSVTLRHLSVFFCLQCAGQDSTSLHSGTWSVQSVRLTVSLTTRGRCTVAVRKTTSVLRETPPPWPAPVSVLLLRSEKPSFSLIHKRGFKTCLNFASRRR